MPKVRYNAHNVAPDTPSSTPDTLRPYIFHGVEFEVVKTAKEALATCPFCYRENKFSVNIENSMFRCWGGSCQVQGNSTTFLRLYWEHCKEETTNTAYEKLASDSGFLNPHAARSFGVVMSTMKDQWLVPGWNHESKLTGLYRYGRIKDSKGKWKSRLLVCPNTGHHLFNLQNFNATKPIIDLCEGWRDGIAWVEGLSSTSRAGNSLINDRNVLAVPGTNSFKPAWTKLFAGKTVNILFDNDHDKNNNGKTVEGAGLQGVKKVASILSSAPSPPETINFLAWNGSAEQCSTDLPDSMDLRDYLTNN